MQRVWHLFIRNLGLRATFNVFIPAISLKIIMVHVPIAKPILKPRMLFFFFLQRRRMVEDLHVSSERNVLLWEVTLLLCHLLSITRDQDIFKTLYEIWIVNKIHNIYRGKKLKRFRLKLGVFVVLEISIFLYDRLLNFIVENEYYSFFSLP